MEKYDLYKGCEIIVDYKSQLNQDIIDFFKEASNFEGYATLENIDYESGLFTIKSMPYDWISFEYLIVMNYNTNEFEYINIQ